MDILEKKEYIKRVNEVIELSNFSENMMDAFILGHKLGLLQNQLNGG